MGSRCLGAIGEKGGGDTWALGRKGGQGGPSGEWGGALCPLGKQGGNPRHLGPLGDNRGTHTWVPWVCVGAPGRVGDLGEVGMWVWVGGSWTPISRVGMMQVAGGGGMGQEGPEGHTLGSPRCSSGSGDEGGGVPSRKIPDMAGNDPPPPLYRCWRCTTSTTRGLRRRRAVSPRPSTPSPSSTMWGARPGWNSSPTWWSELANAADPPTPTPAPSRHPDTSPSPLSPPAPRQKKTKKQLI